MLFDAIINCHLFQPPQKYEDVIPDGIQCEEITLKSDGEDINALYLPAKKPRGYVLSSHGNGDCVWNAWAIEDANRIRESFGVSVLIYDYRGYGKSTGKPTAQGVIKDGQAAARYLCKREKCKSSDLIFHGYSLGGAVAVQCAVKSKAKGLIVESSFSSLRDMAGFWRMLVPNALNSVDAISKYHGVLLQCHGDSDEVIPFEQGRKLFDACPSENKTFVTLKDQDHCINYSAWYLKKQKLFFESLR